MQSKEEVWEVGSKGNARVELEGDLVSKAAYVEESGKLQLVGEKAGVRQLITILPSVEVKEWPGLQAITVFKGSFHYKDQQALCGKDYLPIAYS